MSHELYKRYRPKKLSDVIGQNQAVKVLSKMFEHSDIPHTLLLSGPSGCGKTTAAYIIRRQLNCGKHDFAKINGADKRGIDDARNITKKMHSAPLEGDCRIYLIDECHRMTGDAMSELLEALEFTPEHVYFILATTEPQKLLKAIRTRCTEIVFKSISESDTTKLLNDIVKKEKAKISDEVIERITENSGGSARTALVLLNKIFKLDNEEDMLSSINSATLEKQGFDLAKAIFNYNSKWPDISKLLNELKDEDPETIRWIVLGYAKAILLKAGSKIQDKAFVVIEAFRDNFYDSKHAGLAAACYEIFNKV